MFKRGGGGLMPQIPRPRDTVSVPNTPYEGPVPALPPGASIGVEVREWYAEVSRLPHAGTWTKVDWLSIALICRLKQKVLDALEDEEAKASSVSNLVAEIRRQEDALGITTAGRRRLNIEYVEPIARKASRGSDARDRLKVTG